MNAPAPTTVNLVRLADATAQPWRNGGGLTRELLTWQRPDLPSSQGWSVRVSVADIARDGPFSAYPGVTRAFTVLEGEGVTLDWGDARSRRLGPADDPLHFDGADAPGCQLSGGPTRDLNLMTRSADGQARMGRARPGESGPAPGRWRALYTHAAGRLAIGDAEVSLEPGTLCWQAGPGGADSPRWQWLQGTQAWWLELVPPPKEPAR